MQTLLYLGRQLVVHTLAAVVAAALLWAMTALAPRALVSYIASFSVLTLLCAFSPVRVGMIWRPIVLVLGVTTGGFAGFCLGAWGWGGVAILGAMAQYPAYLTAVQQDDEKNTLAVLPTRDLYGYPIASALAAATVLAIAGYGLTDVGRSLTHSGIGQYLLSLFPGSTERPPAPGFLEIGRIALMLELSFALLYRLTYGLLSGGLTIPETTREESP
jgi:hypothetical protein